MPHKSKFTVPVLVVIALLGAVLIRAPSGRASFAGRDSSASWSVRLVRVSGADPYAGGCGEGGVQDPQANTEPSIAVDPVHPSIEVVAFHAASRGGVGFVDDLVMRSVDGGTRWQRMTTPLTTICTGGQADRNSDPWVAFGPDGRAHYVSLPGRLDSSGFPVTNVLVHNTGPAVRRWAIPNVAASGAFNDRETMTVDPGNPRRLYATWILRSGPKRLHSVLVVAISSDGGQSWRRTIALRPPTGRGSFFVPIGAHIVALPNGTLLDTFITYQGGAPWPVEAIRSPDGGRTWSQPRVLGHTALVAPGDPTDGIVTNMLPIASSVADSNGTAYVAWNDNSTNDSRVLLASTRDSGRSWSQPRVVAAPHAQVLLPALAVGRKHTLCVTWYDFRHDRPNNGKLTTDVWFAISTDGGRHWSQGHIAGPFDMRGAEYLTEDKAGTGGGYYLGDYTTLAARGNAFVAALSLATPYAPPDQPAIYTATISRH